MKDLVVNGDPFSFRDGLTVADVLEEKNYSFPLKTVFVNGKRIPTEDWQTERLHAGDTVEVLHMMSGG